MAASPGSGPRRKLKPPAAAETVDLTGKFVMPGIINLHGHIGNTVDLQQDAKFYTRENIQKNLATYASYGVTTVVSMGTDQDLIFKIRAQQRAGRPAVTRVYTAGQGMIFKGGYGGLAGVTPGVSTAAEAEAAVEAQSKKGVDIIKLWLDDHLGEQKKMPYDIAKAIIDGAHKRNLPVAAHIFYLEDAKQLVDYGVNGLAHSVRDKSVDASSDRRDEKARHVANGAHADARSLHVRLREHSRIRQRSVLRSGACRRQ